LFSTIKQIMKNNLLFLLFIIISCTSLAQEWETSFEAAKAKATKNQSNIVLVFQGSDWCAPCMKLDKEIWSSSEFQNLAKNHFVMLLADFPRKRANKLSEEQTTQNAKLAEIYNNQGYFPLVVVLDKTGKELGKLGYEKLSPRAYFEKLTSLERAN
jgi:thioredoxin-related protein